jgi:hypothetical protein
MVFFYVGLLALGLACHRKLEANTERSPRSMDRVFKE